jgi:hypothetical protein
MCVGMGAEIRIPVIGIRRRDRVNRDSTLETFVPHPFRLRRAGCVHL